MQQIIRRLSVVLFILCTMFFVAWDVIRSTDNASYIGMYRLLRTGEEVRPVLDIQSKACVCLFAVSVIAAIVLLLIKDLDHIFAVLVCIVITVSEVFVMSVTGFCLYTGKQNPVSAWISNAGVTGIPGALISKKLLLIIAAVAALSGIQCLLLYFVRTKPYKGKVILASDVIADIVLLMSVVPMFLSLSNLYDFQSELYRVREVLQSQKTVVHACGKYNDYTYTNSYEALVNCYEEGNRVCEIDFNLTRDNRLVLGHEGGSDAWMVGLDTTDVLTEAQFLDQKYLGELTTMSLDDLADFMRSHEDFYVVTDIKGQNLNNVEGCAIIAAECPDLLDRFIIQIYHISEYGQVRNLGFMNIIFTLYATGETERTTDVLLQNLNDCDLLGFTFWDSWAQDSFVGPIAPSGTLMFVHTVNGEEQIRSFVDRGLYVYTDNTDNAWLR